MTSGLTYPYTKFDRLVGDNLAKDLEFNPGIVPPSGAAGGAGTFKYWVDTTTPALAVLRQCIAVPRATAGVYVPAEWISLGVVDSAAGKFHFNTDVVDFVGGGGGTTTIVNDLTVTDSLTVTGPTTLGGTLTVTGGRVSTQGSSGGFVFYDRLDLTHWWEWYASGGVSYLAATEPVGGGHSWITIEDNTGRASFLGSALSAVSYDLGVMPFAKRDTSGNAHVIYDYDGAAAITLYGAVGSNTNYYTADTHTFQNNASTTSFSISSAGNLDVIGNIDVNGIVAVTGALTADSVGAVTSVFAGTTINTVEYQLRGIPFALTDLGSNYVKIYDPSQLNNMTLYAAGQNYYDATEHVFRNGLGLTTYAIFNAGGTYNASGSWLVISDDSVKENVVPYTAGLAELYRLDPVSFNYVAAAAGSPAAITPFVDSTTTRYGLMSSNVREVLPEMVVESVFTGPDFPDTPLDTLLPTHLVYVLLNACKELGLRVAALEQMQRPQTAQQPA